MASGELLKCIAKNLIYHLPDYKASTKCKVCKYNNVKKCKDVIKIINE